MSNTAIILAAGNGTRMKADKSKLLLKISSKTVIRRTVEAFAALDEIDKIIVVCREGDLSLFKRELDCFDIEYCFGGDTRQKSVMNAVSLAEDCDYILIHDGARPLVTKDVIRKTLKKAEETKCAATGVFVKDTIKVVADNMQITATPDRAHLVSIQTPQIFDYKTYINAVNLAKEQGKDFTDDCCLVENLGVPVFAVDGDYSNIKITTPEDIPLAENILKMRGDT